MKLLEVSSHTYHRINPAQTIFKGSIDSAGLSPDGYGFPLGYVDPSETEHSMKDLIAALNVPKSLDYSIPRDGRIMLALDLAWQWKYEKYKWNLESSERDGMRVEPDAHRDPLKSILSARIEARLRTIENYDRELIGRIAQGCGFIILDTSATRYTWYRRRHEGIMSKYTMERKQFERYYRYSALYLKRYLPFFFYFCLGSAKLMDSLVEAQLARKAYTLFLSDPVVLKLLHGVE